MTRLLLLALALFVAAASSWQPQHSPPIIARSTLVTARQSGNDDNDPTKVWYASLANALQNAITTSPLNEGKKAFVRMLAGDYDEAATRAKIEGLVESEPVLMLSFVRWPFCVKAKAVLDGKGVRYAVVELDEVPDGPALRSELGTMVGRTSVPAIWIKQQFVGGCNDGPLGGIVSLEKEGKLDDMLKAAGAL